MLHCIQEKNEHRDFTRVMASSRRTDGSNIHSRCAKRIEDCMVGAEDFTAQKFELITDFILANYQVHQTALFMFPSKLTNDFDYGPLMRSACPTVSQTASSTATRTWARGWSNTETIMVRSLGTLRVWTFTRLVGPSRVPQETDTADTTGQHHDARHVQSKQFTCQSLLGP